MVGRMAQRGLGVLPNKGGGRRPGDIRGAICPSIISPPSIKDRSRCAVDDHSGKLIVEVERQLHGFLARLQTAGYGEIQGRLMTFRRVSCGSGERRLCVSC